MSYKIDLHTHTLASGHAYSTINEMVSAACAKGMTHLGITEHAPKMPGTCHELYFHNLKIVPRKRDGLTLLMGAELNILDFKGRVDLDDNILRRLDVVIASLHTPCIRPGSITDNTNAYIGAMRNPYVNIIGHPDDARYPVDYEMLVKEAKNTHTLLEINNSSLKPTGSRKGTRENDIILLGLCREYKVPVIFGSDAHIDAGVGDFGLVCELAQELDFPEELIVNRDYNVLKEYLGKLQ